MCRFDPSCQWRRPFLALILLSSGLLARATGQQLTPLSVDDVLRAWTFAAYSPIEFSPDGKWLSYTITTRHNDSRAKSDSFVLTGVPQTAIGADVFIVETRSGKSRAISGGTGNNWLPAWSPDGRNLAFLSDRDGSGQAKLWIWETVSGNLRKVSEVSARTLQLQWLPDSSAVLIGVLPKNLAPVEVATGITGSKLDENESASFPNSTALIYRSHSTSGTGSSASQSPPWTLDADLRDLALIDVANGKVQRIDKGHRISAYFLSPNGLQIAYTTARSFEKSGSQQILFDVVVLPLGAGLARVVASHVQLEFGGTSLSWSPGSSLFAYRSGGVEGNGDCFVVDPKTGVSRNVSSFESRHGFASFAPSWDAEGKHIYFSDGNTLWRASLDQTALTGAAHIPHQKIVRLIEGGSGALWSPHGDRSTIVLAFDEDSKQFELFEIDLASSQSHGLLRIHQCRMCGAFGEFGVVSRDGQRFAYFSEDVQHDTNLWLVAADFRNPRRLTHVNPQFERYQMGSAQLVQWRSLDGEPLRGALLLPAGYRRGKHYPLIVWIYGGERGSDFVDSFGLSFGGPFNLQLLATRGYAILFPDSTQHLGTPMLDIVKSVLPGVDRIIEMGIADPDRLGVMGHSYGGYSALSLIVQTKRFKAAIEADGMADLIAAYGQMGKDGTAFQTSITEQGQGLMGGTPWQFRDRYVENSPIFFLDRVETPLLISHGGDDTTVAPFLGDELFVGLRRLGKEAEYVKYQGEGHSPLEWSYANQMDLCNRMIDWFEKYLKDVGS
jgi:dipeptidyl aminopeptidase/acylaminoacyl peptidase